MTVRRLDGNGAASVVPLHLLEEFNHRVINEYAEALAFLAQAARRASSAAVQKDLAQVSQRLHAFSETHRALLPPVGDGQADLGDYISKICTTLLNASLAENGIKISLETEEVFLAADRCWRVGLIVAELIRNAYRHAFGGQCGSVAIEITERSGRVCCLVSDSGRADPDQAPGRGRRLVQTIAGELGGTVDWSFTSKGSIVQLQVPAIDEPIRTFQSEPLEAPPS